MISPMVSSTHSDVVGAQVVEHERLGVYQQLQDTIPELARKPQRRVDYFPNGRIPI
jgi:hypothetical protein